MKCKNIKAETLLNFLKKEHIDCLFIGDKQLDLHGYSVMELIVDNSVLLVRTLEDYAKTIRSDVKDVLIITTKDIYEVAKSYQNERLPKSAVIITQEAEQVFCEIVKNFFSAEETCGIQNIYIDPRAEIGENTRIEANVSILGRVKIGNNVVIKAGSVIGGEGYAYISDKENCRHKLSSQASVVIGNDVEIGANTCIDNGIIRDTVIGDNVKIANLCHIAHDCQIEENVMLAAGVVVAAYAVIKRNSFIGAGVVIKDNVVIGKDSFVGIGSVVKKSIEKKEKVFGNPAQPYKKQTLVSLQGISKTFNNKVKRQVIKKETLHDVSFDIKDDEIISILGPSGCGKSTLLKIMAGLLNADGGNVHLKNDETSMGMVFQEDALMPWFNVEKNVSIGLKIKGVEKQEIKDKVAAAIKMVGLEGYEKYYPYQLSGGMKKRASIARCLVMNSELLLMDEPFGALDTVTKYAIQEDLVELRKKEHFSICMVTHDIEEAIYMSDRILIVDGKPATIKMIIPVALGENRNREDADFLHIKEEIEKIIKNV